MPRAFGWKMMGRTGAVYQIWDIIRRYRWHFRSRLGLINRLAPAYSDRVTGGLERRPIALAVLALFIQVPL